VSEHEEKNMDHPDGDVLAQLLDRPGLSAGNARAGCRQMRRGNRTPKRAMVSFMDAQETVSQAC
jgi:hypothetical protein